MFQKKFIGFIKDELKNKNMVKIRTKNTKKEKIKKERNYSTVITLFFSQDDCLSGGNNTLEPRSKLG